MQSFSLSLTLPLTAKVTIVADYLHVKSIMNYEDFNTDLWHLLRVAVHSSEQEIDAKIGYKHR